MKKKLAGKIISLMTAAIVAVSMSVCLAGCTADKNQDSKNRGGSDVLEESDDRSESSDNQGMGRYIEKTVLERENYGSTDVCNLADGQLALIDLWNGLYQSSDNGATWDLQEMEWWQNFTAENNIKRATLSPERELMLTYTPYSAYTEEMQSEEAEPEGDSSARELKYMDTDVISEYHLLTRLDGTQTELEFDIKQQNLKFQYDEYGHLFAYAEDTVYEINVSDKSTQKVVSTDGTIIYIQCNGEFLLCVTRDGPNLYRLEDGTQIEDVVLEDFIRENYGTLRNYGNGFNFYTFIGEENIIYLAGEKGLYRHVAQGSSMEQVIDGSLSSLGDPAHHINYATLVENQEFLVSYNDGKIVKFTYDATIPTTPNEKITVYSLQENDTVRQAVSVFQSDNPQLYVSYEVGMKENITREDALKKLSTELLSGSGPDVLILDDMPYASYAEKGILMDLSGKEADITSMNLFHSLLDSLYIDEKLYIVPAEFRLPIIAGHQKDVQTAEDLTGIVDAVETLRGKHPEIPLIGYYTESGIMKSLAMICAPSWRTQDGRLREENIREYLEQCKRIYEMQMRGIPQKKLDEYQELDDWSLQRYGVPYEENTDFNLISESEYLFGNTQLAYGTLNDFDSFMSLLSLSRIKGFEDTMVRFLNGQSENVYCPMTLAGINAATADQDKAVLFVQTLLGMQVQQNTHYGFPVNREAFAQNMVIDAEDMTEEGIYMSFGASFDDGSTIIWDVYAPGEVQKEQLTDWVEQIETAYIRDTVIEDAVYTEGIKYLNGEQDLASAVSAVMNKSLIYISE